MDRHGGPTAVPPPRPPPKLLPRVHQPRHQQPPATPPRMSGTASNTAVVAPARTTPSPAAAFTLAQPRPENERSLNEYVDAPVARAAATTTHQHHHHHASAATAVTKQPQSISKQTAASVLTAAAGIGGSPNQPSNTLPIGTNLGSSLTQPIICPACGRCRCEQCAAPRPLPQAWLCGDSCLCSAETVIDYVTCLCCVKALYYHCAKDRELDRDGDGTTCADAPCSCVPHRRVARWGCMVALASILPCLCLYWPFRGCQSLCAAAYARHSRRRGCRCRSTTGGAGTGAGRDEKRLLDAPTPPPPDSFC